MVPIGIWLAVSAQDAKHDASEIQKAIAKQQPSAPMAGMSTPASAQGARATTSFAGIAPANADALAMAHAAYPAALPAAPAGAVARVTLAMQHRVVTIAPGIRYDAWTFGAGVPGPAIHVRQGQT